MKYLKKFNEHQLYQDYLFDIYFAVPNVSYCKTQKDVHYNPTVDYDFFCKMRLSDGSIVTVDGEGLFTSTTLNNIHIPSGKSIVDIVFGDRCTGLSGDALFKDKTSIVRVYISKTIASIGDRPFRSCSSLETIIVDKNNTVYDSRQRCNAIIHTATNELIQGCKSTKIPNTVVSIGVDAFSRHTGLGETGIVIPNSVTTLKIGAFSACNLKSITIPDSVVTIGNYAFLANLFTSVEIPDSVTTIGYSAFNVSTELESVTIGAGVTTIDDNAFSFDSKLNSITSRATTAPNIYSETFKNLPSKGTLRVPAGSTGYDWWIRYLGYDWTIIEE